VHYVGDLLAEALAASDAARLRIIDLVASEYVVGPSLAEEVKAALATLPPDVLARHLVGGLTVAESGIDLGRLSGASLIAAAIDDDTTFILLAVGALIGTWNRRGRASACG
jgi:arginine deiminase